MRMPNRLAMRMPNRAPIVQSYGNQGSPDKSPLLYEAEKTKNGTIEERRYYAPIVQRPRMLPFHGSDPSSNLGRGIFENGL